MAHEALQASLEELKKVMHTAQQPQRNLLFGIIEKLNEVEKGKEDIDAEALRSHLEEQAVDFEADHPKAAGILRQIMDALNKMGI